MGIKGNIGKRWSFLDLSEQRFGRLVAIRRAGVTKNRKVLWECRCDCGTVCIVQTAQLRNGKTKSCGCLWKESVLKACTKHGGAARDGRGSKMYIVWASMIARCTNPKDPRYKDYGGRGITVCERWRESFAAFLEDVGHRPSDKHELDRFPDNNGNYQLDNIRWATRKQQMRNTRANKLITYMGNTLSMAEWCERLGLNYAKVSYRFRRGWTVEAAFQAPTKQALGIPLAGERTTKGEGS